MSPETETLNEQQSLFERLGGGDAIRATVEEFYVNVLGDADLASFFEATNMDWLKESQIKFFTQALGGPEEYEGRSMEASHAKLAITQEHFDLVAGHLAVTLASLNIHEELIAEVISAVAPLAPAIVTTTTTTETETMTPVTQETAIENDAGSLFSMLENMPINVMCTDLDLTINFVNAQSWKTLAGISQLLPIPADQVMGASIDVFHANPAAQRKLLADPANLPHEAIISLGQEKLQLLVTALRNAKGEYVGPMVTWEVVTEKLQQEKDFKAAQKREREEAETLRGKVGEMLEVVTAAADGDLTQNVAVSGEDAIGQMGEGLHRLLTSLRESIQGIAGTANTLASASEELTATAQQMSATSEETSAQAEVVTGTSKSVSESVQTVAAGTVELSASITEIAKNAAGAAQIANEAVTVTNDTNATISKLGDSSQEIGQVIKVITSIAQQTNLLALNATIEAARAGDAGKGFAVVANEVKELAKETAKATEDIGRKIEAIQGSTHDSVEAIEKISSIIDDINEAQSTIASAVEEQSATTKEMEKSVSDANSGSQEIASNIGGVAQAAQDTSRGASGVESAASDLSKMANELQTLVGKFTY